MAKYPARHFACRRARPPGTTGYGEDGQPIGEVFVVGIAGEPILPIINGQENVDLVRSHNEIANPVGGSASGKVQPPQCL